MKLVQNSGNDRVANLIQPLLSDGHSLDAVTPGLSIFAFAELLVGLQGAARCRFVLPGDTATLPLLGTTADRPNRNRLQSRWLAARLRDWLSENADIRLARDGVPQGALVIRDKAAQPLQALLGSLSLTTDGLGLTPGNPLNLIQASETPDEAWRVHTAPVRPGPVNCS